MNRTFFSRSVFGLIAMAVLLLSPCGGVVSAQTAQRPPAPREQAVKEAARQAKKVAEAKEREAREQDGVRRIAAHSLKHRRADEIVEVLRVVLVDEGISGKERNHIAVDPRQNMIILNAPRDVHEKLRTLLSALDVPPNTNTPTINSIPTPSQLQLRVIWLANIPSDEKAAALPPGLSGVASELAKIGIKGLRMVSQSVIRGLPDRQFDIQSMVVIDARQINLDIVGTLADPQAVAAMEMEARSKRDGSVQAREAAETRRQLAGITGRGGLTTPTANTARKMDFQSRYQETLAAAAKSTPPRVAITIAAKEHGSVQKQGNEDPFAEKPSVTLNTNIQTVISTPYGHYVVLGATPMGSFTSAFIVQLTEVK